MKLSDGFHTSFPFTVVDSRPFTFLPLKRFSTLPSNVVCCAEMRYPSVSPMGPDRPMPPTNSESEVPSTCTLPFEALGRPEGHDVDETRRRSLAVQRALRSAQDFDSLDI